MTTAKIVLLNSVHSHEAKPLLRRAALMLATLVLLVAAPATVVTAQTYTDLYDMGSSGGPNDPRFSAIIAQGRDGNLYSTTNQNFGGGLGDVFKITPSGTLTVIHNFNGTDGQFSIGGLTLATDGKFYGTTGFGGSLGYGTIFSITAEGSLTTLYSFTNGADGSGPQAPPIQGSDGNFYGTTTGVNGNNGSVYKITPSGVFTTLHSFAGTDGANPIAPLVEGADGVFYGTTYNGGTSGAGTIFAISLSGNFKVLFNFGHVPGYPIGPLIQGSDGNFYGTTSGAANSAAGGVVFKFMSGQLTVLHDFAGGSDGYNQVGGLVQATDGNFYGTNDIGPIDFVGGVIFRVSSTGTFATLYDFVGGSAGASAQATLLQHTNGVLYGTTCCGGINSVGNFYSFDVGLGPFVSFLPAAGVVGKTLDILGQGFTGTTGVSFNGTPATFKVWHDTFLTATIPAGATTGFVIVTTPGGTLTSNKQFRVMP
jgi:uncharacterized repeat protein (TIGR03803 family)